MDKNNESLASNDVVALYKRAAEISQHIVDEALQPFWLCDYILNFYDDDKSEDVDALRSAIDSRYLDFQERYNRGERGDVETELNVIEEQVKFFIGVAVGRRVSA